MGIAKSLRKANHLRPLGVSMMELGNYLQQESEKEREKQFFQNMMSGMQNANKNIAGVNENLNNPMANVPERNNYFTPQTADRSGLNVNPNESPLSGDLVNEITNPSPLSTGGGRRRVGTASPLETFQESYIKRSPEDVYNEKINILSKFKNDQLANVQSPSQLNQLYKLAELRKGDIAKPKEKESPLENSFGNTVKGKDGYWYVFDKIKGKYVNAGTEYPLDKTGKDSKGYTTRPMLINGIQTLVTYDGEGNVVSQKQLGDKNAFSNPNLKKAIEEKKALDSAKQVITETEIENPEASFWNSKPDKIPGVPDTTNVLDGYNYTNEQLDALKEQAKSDMLIASEEGLKKYRAEGTKFHIDDAIKRGLSRQVVKRVLEKQGITGNKLEAALDYYEVAKNE